MFSKDAAVLQGTIELLFASWIETATDDVLRVEEGSLYPALYRMVAATHDWVGEGAFTGGNTLALVPSVVAVMAVVGMVAAPAPARRGLAVQPTEALRDE